MISVILVNRFDFNMLFVDYPYNTQNHCKRQLCKDRKSIKDSLKRCLPTITKSPLNRCSHNKSLTDSSKCIQQRVVNTSNTRSSQSFYAYLHSIPAYGRTNKKSIREIELAFLLLKRKFYLITNSYNTKEQTEILDYENTVISDKLTEMRYLLNQLVDNHTNIKAQLNNAHRILYNTEIEYQNTLKQYNSIVNEGDRDDSVLKDISKMQIELGIVSNEVERTERIIKQKKNLIERNTTKYNKLKNNYDKLVESVDKYEELVKVKERNKVKLSFVKTRHNLTKGEYIKRVSDLVFKKSSLLSSIQMHSMYFLYAYSPSISNKQKKTFDSLSKKLRALRGVKESNGIRSVCLKRNYKNCLQNLLGLKTNANQTNIDMVRVV